jgi:hypothetical protein
VKAVLRLVIIYFTAVPLLRWLSIATIITTALAAYGLIAHPQLIFTPYESGFGVVAITLVWALLCNPFFGLFFGSALMPVMVGRFAVGHQIYVLPMGRVKILASALVTTVLVSIPTTIVVAAAYAGLPFSSEAAAARAFVGSIGGYGVLYFVLWCLASLRGGTARMLAGTMIMIASMALPLYFITRAGTSSVLWPAIATAGVWLAFAALFLLAARLKRMLATLRAWFGDRYLALFGTDYRPGREIDLMLGTSQPWLLGLGQVLLIAIAAPLVAWPPLWLFFLTLFGAISGAVTSFAAIRSRALWLRADWSRDELFQRVERAFWRYNLHALAAILILLVGISRYYDLPSQLSLLGLPLLVLSTTASTYLGLMMTRGLGWLEAVLGALTMAVLMAASGFIVNGNVEVVVALEAAGAILTVAFRHAARQRWTGVDWMLCRPELGVRPSA